MKKINMKSLLRISGTVLGVLLVFTLLPVIANAAGKVTVTSPNGVNIRSGAGTNSVIIASGLTNDTFDYLGSEKDSSGATWYKVQVDANTVGYIYAEFATTDGAAQTTTTTTTTTQETPAQDPTVATEVEPVVGTVTADVNVREGASTKHKIVTAAKTGSKVTILGYYDAADGYKWYNVSYTNNTSSVSGYIRADFVKTEAELVDKVDEPVVEPEPEEPVIEEPVPQEPIKVYKDYEAVFDEAEGVWYLENYIEGEKHKVTDLYDAYDKVKSVENNAKAEIRKQKIAIGLLTFVIIALLVAAVVVYILFRRWYFGYDDTEEAVSVKKPEKQQPVKRTPVVDEDDDDEEDDDITLVRRTSAKVSAQTIDPKPASSTVLNKIPEGGKRLPDGRIQMPDGSIRRAVVGVKLADGSIRLPDGRIRKPDGTVIPAPAQDASPSVATAPKAPVTNMTLDDDDDDMELGFIGGNLSSDLDEE